MDKFMYYVIQNSDGDTSINTFSKDELLRYIEENNYGSDDFLDRLKSSDTNYWNGKILIIKGDIITPQAKEVVKKYDIE